MKYRKGRKGRPPGSKNKKTLEKEEQARQQAVLQATEPTRITETAKEKQSRKPGRPLGSKDKNPSGKRKGRVLGSRNKTTKARDAILTQIGEEYVHGKS